MNSEIGGKDMESDHGIVYARDLEEILESLRVPIVSIDAYKPDDRSDELTGNGIVPVNVRIEISKGDFNKETLENTLQSDVKYALTQFNSSKKYFAEPLETPLDLTLEEDRESFIAIVKTFGRAKHPTQIYESVTYFVNFLSLDRNLVEIQRTGAGRTSSGAFPGFCFWNALRVGVFKENQVEFEEGLQYNMGQLLSIPLVLGGIFLIVKALKNGLKPIKDQGTGS